jgi:PAS domain S-box-containing protein
LWVQVVGQLWLSFIVQLVYLRVYREPFLRLWSLSFAFLGLALGFQIALRSPYSKELITAPAPYLIGLLQFPLIVLAALSIKPRGPSLRRQVLLVTGMMAGLVSLFLVTASAVPDLDRLARVLRLERQSVGAVAMAWFAIAFWRGHPLARTVGGRVTALFTGLYAVHHVAQAMAVLGLPAYPPGYSVIAGAAAAALPFAIAAGMIVVASEAMTATTKRLRDSEDRYRTLVEASPDGIVATDPSGTILMCNRRAAEVFGYAGADELVGKAAAMLVAPADRERVRNAARSLATSVGPVGIECQVVLRDGSERSAELTSAPLRTSDGTIAASVTIMHDMTERKEAEAARARLESQLLQHQRLDSIGRLAGGVAHDFNNHLTVINGYCDLILSGMAPNDPNRESLMDVRRAGDRAATLTRQLLAFGRKQRLSPTVVSLNQIVSSMETMLRRLVPENIAVTTTLAPELGTAMADTGQIEQAVMNLVANARDAMPEGGRLLIETANVDLQSPLGEPDQGIAPGPYVALSVTDTGIGMDERTRSLVFEPFFTTKDVGKGTGLGLAMVYGFVQQSGGAITVRSKPGEGSVFTMYLPRLGVQPTPIPVAPAGEHSRSGQGTILLVEDQENVRRLLAQVLRSAGYSVIEAEGGPQALALPDSQIASLDLLITDVVMPGMSGRQLATRLGVCREALRVLFISGYAPTAVMQQDIVDSSVAFLQKPFSPAQITAKVSELLAAK